MLCCIATFNALLIPTFSSVSNHTVTLEVVVDNDKASQKQVSGEVTINGHIVSTALTPPTPPVSPASLSSLPSIDQSLNNSNLNRVHYRVLSSSSTSSSSYHLHHKMVSESFKSLPHQIPPTSSVPLSEHHHQQQQQLSPVSSFRVSRNYSGDHSTSGMASAMAKKVCGVVLVDERTYFQRQFSPTSSRARPVLVSTNTSLMSVLSSRSSSDCSRRDSYYSHHAGLVLGSVLLDRESCPGDELRRLIISQLAAAPKKFAFLSNNR